VEFLLAIVSPTTPARVYRLIPIGEKLLKPEGKSLVGIVEKLEFSGN